MNRSRIAELHYIAPFANIPSILDTGIRCHTEMKGLPHESVADEEVQKRRAATKLPGGRPLHSYVNLYVDARNVMLYVLRPYYGQLAVLRIEPAVLDLPDVIVSDRNAASGSASFRPMAEGIMRLDEEAVFADWWNQSLEARQKRCAEVLVPVAVRPQHICGAYVMSDKQRLELEDLVRPRALNVSVNAHMFYGS
jgi:hypothetical protein